MAERKVIIRGQVFDYAEKAPFVVSGMSVLGAIEYDSDEDLLRCHECGDWFGNVSGHARQAHDLPVNEYKFRHGLRVDSPLIGMRHRKALAVAAKRYSSLKRRIPRKGERLTFMPKRNRRVNIPLLKSDDLDIQTVAKRQSYENRNLQATCQAQIIFRIQKLASQLGRTPTGRELQKSGLCPNTVVKAFEKGTLNEVMSLLGLPINDPIRRTRDASGKWGKLNERMPWPEEYTGGAFGIEIGSHPPSLEVKPTP